MVIFPPGSPVRGSTIPGPTVQGPIVWGPTVRGPICLEPYEGGLGGEGGTGVEGDNRDEGDEGGGEGEGDEGEWVINLAWLNCSSQQGSRQLGPGQLGQNHEWMNDQERAAKIALVVQNLYILLGTSWKHYTPTKSFSFYIVQKAGPSHSREYKKPCWLVEN